MATINPERTVIVGPMRTSWMYVFKPREKDGKTQYEVTLLLPKKSSNHQYFVDGELQKVATAIRAAIADQFGAQEVDAMMKAPATIFKMCLKDGDKEMMSVKLPDGSSDWQPKWPGMWFLNATAKADYPPKLYNADRSEAKVSDGWVSGDWTKAQLHFFGFKRPDAKGVSCGLRAMQFCFKDEPFGGGGVTTATADDFGTVEGAYIPPTSGGRANYGAEASAAANYGSADPRDELDDPFGDA